MINSLGMDNLQYHIIVSELEYTLICAENEKVLSVPILHKSQVKVIIFTSF